MRQHGWLRDAASLGAAMARKVCIVTGTRAEYGLLSHLMSEVKRDSRVKLQVVATGTHLAPEFGLTWREIEGDGFQIDRKLEILLASDTGVGVAKTVGLATISFADAFSDLRPDIIVILGDRFEMLAAASAALVMKIPVAHIAGGDVTEGAFDESIRHAITKMAHLHFVTNGDSKARVCQLGEDPAHVHDVGAPGLDSIAKLEPFSREQLSRDLGFVFRDRNVLVTWHPETLAAESAGDAYQEVLAALDLLGAGYGIIFTRANADPAGRLINSMTDRFVASHANAAVFASLGQKRYLSLVRQVDFVAGNSSSGLYEVPSLKKPTVNIGNRQTGRLMAASVINVQCERDLIFKAFQGAMAMDCTNVINPYGGDGHTSTRIKDILGGVDVQQLLFKSFHDVTRD
jgi:UDP-N-acetylglucosamine 2-epimerase (non-hydrolysing)/GDP/UDP-N,N'-diacetylbacillosamine 2-epimerase (hydrolysing)